MTKLEQFYNMAKRSNNFDEFVDAIRGLRDLKLVIEVFSYYLDCAFRASQRTAYMKKDKPRPELKEGVVEYGTKEGVLK